MDGVFSLRASAWVFLFFAFARNDEMTMLMAMRRVEMNDGLERLG